MNDWVRFLNLNEFAEHLRTTGSDRLTDFAAEIFELLSVENADDLEIALNVVTQAYMRGADLI